MTLSRLIWQSVRYHWRTGLTILCGIALATAVITGSLLVGDSVTGSIRDTALARLGNIDQAITAPGFFRAALAQDLARDPRLAATVRYLVPLTIVHGAAHKSTSDITLPDVTAIGVPDTFRQCFPGAPPFTLVGREVAVNAALARDLKLAPDDYLLLTVERQSDAAGATVFAATHRDDTTRVLRLKVAAILPDNGVGGFALRAGTRAPRNIFLAQDWLSARLDHLEQANTLVAVRNMSHGARPVTLQQALAAHCTPEDYGLTLTARPGYLAVQSNRVVMSERQAQALQQAAAACGARTAPVSVYLATAIRESAGSRRTIAYAILAGVDPAFALPPGSGARAITGDGLWLNRWTAQDLGATLGDKVTVSYLTPAADGSERTLQQALTVRGIVPLTGTADDAGLVPDFAGISNVQRMEDWNPPFPIDMSRVTARDEAYWTAYRTTPKAFVNLPVARAMWQSGPFDQQTDWITTLCVYPKVGMSVATLAGMFPTALATALSPEQSGLLFQPVREEALASAHSPTDFGQLFLSMSFLLILAAAGMAGMLMRLLVERRAVTVGMMLACGLPRMLVLRAMLGEGLVLVAGGACIGMPLGLLYAEAILQLLTTRWSAEVGGAATLWLHVTASSLLIGGMTGLLAGLLAVGWGVWSLLRERVLSLLTGMARQAFTPRPARKRSAWLPALLLPCAAGMIVLSAGHFVSAELAFFTAGFLLLISGLLCCRLWLLGIARGARVSHPVQPSFVRLALRSAAANRKRSLLTVGLLASACFILVTVAANSRDYAQSALLDKRSGSGGFSLCALASVPIADNFGSAFGRAQLGFDPTDEALLQRTRVLPFLMSPGGDISCLNITRTPQPRLLGVPPEMIARGGFTVTTADKQVASPWSLLNTALPDGCIPAFGDADSVRWTLHADLGEVYTISGPDGQPVRLRIVGLLSGSIFAGELLVSRENFSRLYPTLTTPRLFLIDTSPGDLAPVADALRANLGALGLEVTSTRELLNRYLSVQQTYLSTFLALGGLGLLLGVFGMVVMLLRNAFDRRKEFALLLALGFSRAVLARLLLMENVTLLLLGVVCGTASALIASIPQLIAPEARVNWPDLIGLLCAIVLVGIVACALAGRTAVRTGLLMALRAE